MLPRGSRRRFFAQVGTITAASVMQGRALSQRAGGIRVPAVQHHPASELDDGRSAEPSTWEAVGPGLQLSFASRNACYLRHEVPQLQITRHIHETAWRGERVNLLALAWAKEAVEQLRCEASPLRGQRGALITPDHVRARFVRYVASNHPFASIDTVCEEANGSEIWLLPDLLDPLDRMDLEAHTVRPIWLSVDIPGDAKPGVYEGHVTVKSHRGDDATLGLRLTVQDALLPAPSDWKFRLDLWQNPWAVAHHHGLEPWSKPHLEILRPHLRMLAEAGAKFTTTYICHSPWKDDTYVADSTMVEWIRKPDGSWRFDYSILDHYVELAASCGLNQAITCYTMLPWKNRVRYLDAGTGDYRWEEWAPESEQFREFWRIFLKELRGHLVERGWFERTYMGINENELEDTLASIRTLKQDSEQWKVTYAGHWHPELNDLLDDYCVIIDRSMAPEVIDRRRSQGKTSTFYVCCHPPRPNNFVFSSPAEGAWMGWYAAAFGYDGFLRWAYDSWTADPARDARHALWPAGDCFLVYPGARSSVRFERLREGIADFEKLRVLAGLVDGKASPEDDAFRSMGRNVLALFDYQRVQSQPAGEAVSAGRQFLSAQTAKLIGG